MVAVKLDRFGRIVIPKEIRDRYGWAAGSNLSLVPDEEGVHLQRIAGAESGRGLAVEHGRMVFDARWSDSSRMTAEDVRALLEDVRDERDG